MDVWLVQVATYGLLLVMEGCVLVYRVLAVWDMWDQREAARVLLASLVMLLTH